MGLAPPPTRRAELAEFLRYHREGTTPDAVRLATSAHRRTPGLRRERSHSWPASSSPGTHGWSRDVTSHRPQCPRARRMAGRTFSGGCSPTPRRARTRGTTRAPHAGRFRAEPSGPAPDPVRPRRCGHPRGLWLRARAVHWREVVDRPLGNPTTNATELPAQQTCRRFPIVVERSASGRFPAPVAAVDADCHLCRPGAPR